MKETNNLCELTHCKRQAVPSQKLIEKYNVAAPRYTSYPTVPYWDQLPPTNQKWEALVKDTFKKTNDLEGISLYIHLPFCESLCTYCGCNTRITVNHQVESPYIQALLKEWQMYLALFESKPKIREIHLGGGTPTFFQPDNLKYLISNLLKTAEIASDAEFSFEAHPDNTSRAHLETLFELGFKRISLGIQDFDPKVQFVINRIQSVEAVERVTREAREIGFTSINYDLIYGLPLQTIDSISQTIAKVVELMPDRIAFYSYAHVPWLKPGQRKFTEADLPIGEEKRKLYELGRNSLEKAGFVEIGMDHFALPDDPLNYAEQNKQLHRNFMGYTTSHSQLLIGLGASSISDTWTGFVQNEKKVEDYYRALDENRFPFFKGHVLTEEDLTVRKHILNIMCKQETSWNTPFLPMQHVFANAIDKLTEMEEDNLIEFTPNGLKVKAAGKPFLRNVCMAFDLKLVAEQPSTQIFSSAV
jgi:oxygen-independent coproporphyrinogen-3 oxidase